MQHSYFIFILFSSFLLKSCNSKCPLGQAVAHDGKCIEAFTFEIKPQNIT